MSLIFVYGTLKRGGANQGYLTRQRFVGEARTLAGFKLYELTGFPGMVRDAAAKSTVEGEVWDVDDIALAQLDVLEGLEEGLYRREQVSLAAPFSQDVVQAYLYAGEVTNLPVIGPVWPPKRSR